MCAMCVMCEGETHVVRGIGEDKEFREDKEIKERVGNRKRKKPLGSVRGFLVRR